MGKSFASYSILQITFSTQSLFHQVALAASTESIDQAALLCHLMRHNRLDHNTMQSGSAD